VTSVAIDDSGNLYVVGLTDGDLDGELIDSQVTGNDQGSQEYDLRAQQLGAGSGLITLDNTTIGDSALTGVTLDVAP